jgi:hypothetical protein
MNALQNWRTEAKALLGPSPITFESRQQCRRLVGYSEYRRVSAHVRDAPLSYFLGLHLSRMHLKEGVTCKRDATVGFRRHRGFGLFDCGPLARTSLGIRAGVRLAGRRGWDVVEVYSDAGISGAKGRNARPVSTTCSRTPAGGNSMSSAIDLIITPAPQI